MGQLNLGPDGLKGPDSPFEISFDNWTEIYNYSNNVSNTSPDQVQLISSTFPAFSQLQKCAAQWTAHTFTGIIGLSNSIYSYGTSQVPVSYNRLKAILEKFDAGTAVSQDLVDFNATMDSCISQVNLLCGATPGLISDIASYADSMEQIKGQLGDDWMDKILQKISVGSESYEQVIAEISGTLSTIASITTKVQIPPFQAMEKSAGDLIAIKSDLDFIKDYINKEISTKQAFLSELEVDMAISEWQSVADEANSFTKNANSLIK